MELKIRRSIAGWGRRVMLLPFATEDAIAAING